VSIPEDGVPAIVVMAALALTVSVRQSAIGAAGKCSNRIARHRPEKPVFVRLTCVDDLY
jgi:hypothetical protein